VKNDSENHLKLYVERSNVAGVVTPDRDDEAAPPVVTVEALEAELQRTRRALWKREAELAAGVPLVPQPQPQRHLAERMEAALKGVAEALGCRAAAVYLLDAATTELKLRAAFGLPFERYLDPARPLATAVADVEALAGHAVVLEDTTNYAAWNLPEACRSAVCVPVSSPTVPLGTLWLLADEPRAFRDQDVNIVEIGAGRIAADLEREMLLVETRDTARLRRAWDDAAHRRAARTPQIAPLCDGWEIAGRVLPFDTATSQFFDWLSVGDGELAATVGAVEQHDFSAALDVETIRAAWRAHARHEPQSGRLLELVNDDLWCGSAETSPAHLLSVRTAPGGRIEFASAGRVAAAVVGRRRAERIDAAAGALATDPESCYATTSAELDVGETIVLSDDAKLIERLVAVGPQAAAGLSPKISATRLLDHFTGLIEADDEPHAALVVLRRKA
jgi:phosphoserine phosphatase RsbU/P